MSKSVTLSLADRLRAAEYALMAHPHPTDCDHIHEACAVMREALATLTAASSTPADPVVRSVESDPGEWTHYFTIGSEVYAVFREGSEVSVLVTEIGSAKIKGLSRQADPVGGRRAHHCSSCDQVTQLQHVCDECGECEPYKRAEPVSSAGAWRPISEAPRDRDILAKRGPIGHSELHPRYGVCRLDSRGLFWDWPWGISPTHFRELEEPSNG